MDDGMSELQKQEYCLSILGYLNCHVLLIDV